MTATRYARIRCECGERVGFVVQSEEHDRYAVVQLRRRHEAPWHGLLGNVDNRDPVGQLTTAMDALGLDRYDHVIVFTGCPKCRRMLTIPKQDISAAVAAFNASGKTQDLEAVPHDRPSTE